MGCDFVTNQKVFYSITEQFVVVVSKKVINYLKAEISLKNYLFFIKGSKISPPSLNLYKNYNFNLVLAPHEARVWPDSCCGVQYV